MGLINSSDEKAIRSRRPDIHIIRGFWKDLREI